MRWARLGDNIPWKMTEIISSPRGFILTDNEMFSFYTVAVLLLQCSNLSFKEFLEQEQPSFRPVSVYPYWNTICQFISIITLIFTLASLTSQTCFIPRHKQDILMFLLCRAQLVMLPHLKHVINMESLSNHGAELSQNQSHSSSQFCMLQFPTTQHFYSGKSLIQELVKWKICSSTETNDHSLKYICIARKFN